MGRLSTKSNRQVCLFLYTTLFLCQKRIMRTMDYRPLFLNLLRLCFCDQNLLMVAWPCSHKNILSAVRDISSSD